MERNSILWKCKNASFSSPLLVRWGLWLRASVVFFVLGGSCFSASGGGRGRGRQTMHCRFWKDGGGGDDGCITSVCRGDGNLVVTYNFSQVHVNLLVGRVWARYSFLLR